MALAGKNVDIIVITKEASRNEVALISKACFEAGDFIFSESTCLHTLGARSREYDIDEDIDIAFDWQRLIYTWCSILLDKNHEFNDIASKCLDELSCEGVKSKLAKLKDPSRESDYEIAAAKIQQKFPKLHANIIEKMISILETNCHSRQYHELEFADAVGTSGGLDFEEVFSMDEEFVGVWYRASTMQHSCIPNATVDILLDSKYGPAILRVKSLRSIKPGDLITINYLGEDFFPYFLRQKKLNKRGFECNCKLCLVTSRLDITRPFQCPNACFMNVCYPSSHSKSLVCENCGNIPVPDALLSSTKSEKQLLDVDLILETLYSDELADSRCESASANALQIASNIQKNSSYKQNEVSALINEISKNFEQFKSHNLFQISHWLVFEDLTRKLDVLELGFSTQTFYTPQHYYLALLAICNLYHKNYRRLTGINDYYSETFDNLMKRFQKYSLLW